MSIKVNKIESKFTIKDDVGVTIIPANYKEEENFKYTSSSLSFLKYSKSTLDISLYSEPEFLYEQRAGDWFAPAILVTSLLISENPEIVSIICGVISNYVTDIFKGQKRPNIRLTVVHKETKSSKLTEINYTGDVDGLDKLKDTILEVSKEK
jgi:hypothetical protein